jgi:two-component system sensor histidine kinase VicK
MMTAMMDKANEMFFVFDMQQLVFTYVNPACEVVTRRKITELLNNPISFLNAIHKEDLSYVKDSLKVLSTKKDSSLLDFRIVRPDNRERWIRLKAYPIIDNDEVQCLVGIAEDDSARRVNIYNLEKVNAWKNTNLEIISHDLRGPIGIVKMFSSAISNKMPENKEIQKLAELIGEISQRNINLIQNVLSSEALDTANLEARKERHNVVWEAGQAMDIYIKSQQELHKRIIYTSSHDSIYASIDNMKFLQILNNLVSNAIKFTGENGLIKVHLEQLENSFLLTIDDDGVGIPKKMQPILFKKYTPAGRRSVDGEEPVGLGMWIVKMNTEAHNGKVWFESEADIGSKFYVEIPFGFN